MLDLLLLLCVVVSLFSYVSMDPMKSSFFLIGSMLMLMPLLTFSSNVWFSYFVCLLFLSGIFVILVYFSSLSSFGFGKVKFVILGFVMTLFYAFFVGYNMMKDLLGLNVFYYSIYWFVLVYIFLVLLGFMNFTSYFLSFSGALRKM